jgi:hypothetical protein
MFSSQTYNLKRKFNCSENKLRIYSLPAWCIVNKVKV